MLKSLIVSLLITLSSAHIYGQKVQIKKDQVYLEGKPILKYNKINLAQVSFYSLSGEEILFYHSVENAIGHKNEETYVVLNFIPLKTKVRISDYSRIASAGIKKAMEKLIKWLLADQVLTVSGELNLQKLELFRQKYQESKYYQ